MNQVVLIGNVATDPEIKFTKSEKKMATWNLAVKRTYKSSQSADFLRCECFGPLAGIVEEHVKKGQKIAVQGSIKNNEYTDPLTGKRKYSVLIYADTVEFNLGRTKKKPENFNQISDEEYANLPYN